MEHGRNICDQHTNVRVIDIKMLFEIIWIGTIRGECRQKRGWIQTKPSRTATWKQTATKAERKPDGISYRS